MNKQRDDDGKYTFDGRLDRMCVCGHTLGVHGAGGQRDCVFYSLSEREKQGEPGYDKPNCGCPRFRETRKKR